MYTPFGYGMVINVNKKGRFLINSKNLLIFVAEIKPISNPVVEKEKIDAEKEKQKIQASKPEEEKNIKSENMEKNENPDPGALVCIKLKWGGVVYLEVMDLILAPTNSTFF